MGGEEGMLQQNSNVRWLAASYLTISFDRLVPNPINLFPTYNFKSLIQAVFAQNI